MFPAHKVPLGESGFHSEPGEIASPHMEFLGFLTNSIQMKFKLPSAKVQEMQADDVGISINFSVMIDFAHTHPFPFKTLTSKERKYSRKGQKFKMFNFVSQGHSQRLPPGLL